MPCPSRRNQYGKQNVEFLDVQVEIEKSKNELFEMSHILIYLATFLSFWLGSYLEQAPDRYKIIKHLELRWSQSEALKK